MKLALVTLMLVSTTALVLFAPGAIADPCSTNSGFSNGCLSQWAGTDFGECEGPVVDQSGVFVGVGGYVAPCSAGVAVLVP